MQRGLPESAASQMPPKEAKNKPENVIDAGSQLNDKETTRLRELNIKNSAESLESHETIERDNLDAKRTGKDLGPLSDEERNLIAELQKKQSESKNWTGKDANLLHILRNREQLGEIENKQMVA